MLPFPTTFQSYLRSNSDDGQNVGTLVTDASFQSYLRSNSDIAQEKPTVLIDALSILP